MPGFRPYQATAITLQCKASPPQYDRRARILDLVKRALEEAGYLCERSPTGLECETIQVKEPGLAKSR